MDNKILKVRPRLSIISSVVWPLGIEENSKSLFAFIALRVTLNLVGVSFVFGHTFTKSKSKPATTLHEELCAIHRTWGQWGWADQTP